MSQLSVSAALAYSDAVIAGYIDACRIAKQACERAKRMETDTRFVFDTGAVEKVFKFFSLLQHSKGQYRGQSFRLEPWQGWILSQIFGWRHADSGLRVYRTAYIEVPRKNGKSTLLSGIALYMLIADNEPGAEVYAAATKKDQALIVFEEARRMVLSSPSLRRHVTIFKNNMSIEQTFSKFSPLGADADTLDGLNPHAAIIDELHAHKTRDVWDVIETGTGARLQSLLYAITTAGFNQQGICYEQRTYLTKILDGIVDDPSYFGVVYSLDRDPQTGELLDDWQTDKAWRKANPNYGVSVIPDDIKRLAVKAAEMPSATNNFLTKRLNVWTAQQTLWMPMDKWSACGSTIPLGNLRGKHCYVGMDLSSTRDITAVVLCFPQEDESIVVHPMFYLPETAVAERVRRDKVPYDVWEKQGLITLTPGDIIDYKFIQADLNRLRVEHELRELSYDPWGATGLTTDLQEDGIVVVPHRQGYASMSAPSKELERLVLAGKIKHGNNPVLNWMMSNVAIMTNPEGYIKPAKNLSTEKIDGVVALVMAISRIMVHRATGPSVYERRGVMIL